MQNTMDEYVIGTVILRLEAALQDIRNNNYTSGEYKIDYIIDELKKYSYDMADNS